jgi:hypothetical protein
MCPSRRMTPAIEKRAMKRIKAPIHVVLRRFSCRISNAVRRHGAIGAAAAALSRMLRPITRREARRRSRERQIAFDRELNIETTDIVHLNALAVGGTTAEHGTGYQPSDPDLFSGIVRSLTIDLGKYTFVDFGSGKGRVVLMAAMLPFRRIVGVEFAEALHQIACDNKARFPTDKLRCEHVELLRMDAVDFVIPEGPLVLYFHNPFDKVVMDRVASNISRSATQRPRPIYVILVAVWYSVTIPGFRQFEAAEQLHDTLVLTNNEAYGSADV